MEWMTLHDAAGQLGLAVQTLRVQARLGRFRATKVGYQYLTTQAAIDEYRQTSLGRFAPRQKEGQGNG
jgi:hypothetical protein